MTALLQISDPHFGCEQAQVMQALESLAHAKKPDVLIVSGDITQRATRGQFAAARAFCDRLQVPQMLAVPGNHDISLFNVFERFVRPYAAYREAFGQTLEQHLQTPTLSISTVNATRWWRHKNGEISRAQIDRVCEQLSRATPQQLRVVVAHQPLHVLREQDEHDRVIGWKAAVQAWANAGADIVMGGHIHLPYVCELSSQVEGLKRRMWCVQAGTAVSTRIRREAPNSVNWVEFSSDADDLYCSVERWDYHAPAENTGTAGPAASVGQFSLAHTSVLNLQRSLTAAV
jgi:3',5'-cyclic AMP phosphodiesterase CpdA